MTEDEAIWRRDCVKDMEIGCKYDNRDNGTHKWEIEICVCDKNWCNEEMTEISTSSTAKTTTSRGN